MRWALVCLALVALPWGDAAWGGAAAGADSGPRPIGVAQIHRLPLPGPRGEDVPTPTPHRPGELDCRNCHEGKHQSIMRMYLGMGGRGTPMIPSHMFQVRVECVACHAAPQEIKEATGLAERTFEPTEEACLACHGEKYRGMLLRWRSTLDRMQEILVPKLEAARTAISAADPRSPKTARARKLLEDAEFNALFVVLAKGVHNVFYAADLLKLSNGWLEEALSLLGKRARAGDDALVRGGYCGVLCHDQAGVKLPATVAFGKQKIPHARHVSEFGAVCTACHSADVHKAVTATPATCASCHHSPQNDRCESCHRAQSAFYRGRVKTDLAAITPNVMAEVVGCTGCHDLSAKHSVRAVGQTCVGCHDQGYLAFMGEWTTELDKDVARAGQALKRAEAAVAGERRAGRRGGESERLAAEARRALDLVRKARGAHNPDAAQALVQAARTKAEAALAAARGAGR
jgi:hypothetical protein